MSEDDGNKIMESGKQAESEKESFFKTVIDFIKWTTTFALASIVWVTSNFSNLALFKPLLWLSFSLLILSVIVSIIIVYSTVFNQNKNWDQSNFLFEMNIHVHVAKLTDPTQLKNLKTPAPSIRPSWYWKFLPETPNTFNKALLLHLICLLLGLISYGFAIIIPSLFPPPPI